MKKKVFGMLALLIAFAMIFASATVLAAPAGALPEGEAIAAEGDSAEGESADSEGESTEDAAPAEGESGESEGESSEDAAPAEGEVTEDAAPAEGESGESEGESSEDAAPVEGESAEGDSAEGESAEGESAEGESAEGESAEGESAAGESSEGDSPSSESADANVLSVIDGEITQQTNLGSLQTADGSVLETANISGVLILGATEETNGIYIKTEDDDLVTTLGGAEEYFEVEGFGSFNSIIDVYGRKDADPESEGTYGTAITVSGGVLVIDNVYATTEGWRTSALYAVTSDHMADVVVKDSVLSTAGADGSFMPDFKLLVGSARSTLLNAGDVWSYNSSFLSRDWGSFSQDGIKGIRTNAYLVNTISETYRGGYTLFALDCTDNHIYGSRMVSPEFGLFAFGAGGIFLDNIEAADEAALKYAEGADFSETVTEDGSSFVAGGINAIVLNAMSGNAPANITVRHTTLSTMEEDITSVYGNEMFFDLDSFLTNPARYGESWFYLANLKGAVITTRSHAGVFNLEEGTVIRSASGVLIQTGLEFDDFAGDLYRDSDDDVVLDNYILNINAPVEGDIIHEDYQRDLLATITSEYTGRCVTGSITAWNNLWSKEGLAALLEKYGMTDKFDLTDEAVANIRSILVREEDTAAYTDVFGIKMTLAEGAVWNVQGESSVVTLTVAEGAAVNASEIYVDCAFGEDGYLDAATGTAIETLEAGEYNNVVLIG